MVPMQSDARSVGNTLQRDAKSTSDNASTTRSLLLPPYYFFWYTIKLKATNDICKESHPVPKT